MVAVANRPAATRSRFNQMEIWELRMVPSKVRAVKINRPSGRRAGRLAALLAVGLLWGCGHKSPPVPPEQPKPPAVRKIAHDIADGRLTLSWQVAPDAEEAGFNVYRFRQPLTEPHCPTCPVPFTLAAELSVPEVPAKGDVRVYRHEAPLDKAHRYIYKVNARMKGGGIGPDSEQVKFEY